MTPVHILSKVLGYCLANLNVEECRNLLDALCLQDISQRHVTAEGIVDYVFSGLPAKSSNKEQE